MTDGDGLGKARSGQRVGAGLVGALRFLTRVSIPGPGDVDHRDVVPWFPVAGALIGAVVGTIAVGLGEILPAPLAATLAVVAGLLITGAFHEDGLADVADAFGGGWNREQRLAILKDSRHGTYGVATLCSSIVVRVVAVATIASATNGQAVVFAGFVAAHTLARAAAVGVLGFVRPAAPDVQGLGVAAGRELRRFTTIGSIITGLLLAGLATGWWVAPLAGHRCRRSCGRGNPCSAQDRRCRRRRARCDRTGCRVSHPDRRRRTRRPPPPVVGMKARRDRGMQVWRHL
ncbi:MAG TPA: adenosylcobinamide-GDP ribazoletransferase, partial [Ilumatobacteraceae bacterium]|nr:adenosylcobinamide-GDP ribazoletransferase [Ilumatobacteraceae bacterium]